MKFLSLGLVIFITGCCCNKVMDESLKDISEYPKEELGESLSTPKYSDNLVACRPNHTEKEKVDSVVKAAIKSNKDIVLYFHGGLSSQKYMVNDLGPALMESFFNDADINEKLHPIFINYDADPKQNFKHFYDDVMATLKNDAYKAIKKKLKDKLGIKDEKSISNAGYQVLDINAAALIDNFKNDASKSATKSITINKAYVTNNQEYYIELLKAKELPSEFIQANKGFVSDLDEMASALLRLDNLNKSTKALNLDVLGLNEAALRIIRILARFALNSHHDFIATIQEEILDAVKVSKLGALHWDLVKRHSKQCFSEGSNGREIVDVLIKENRKIHTISHSAGSIPTAELVNYISKNKSDFKLSNVVMLVPALNHEVFREYVINNKNEDGTHKAFDNLYVYSLTEKYEKQDMVLSDWLYSSSLLYGVSSMGEEEITLDQMLLINQHLKNDRSPYSNSRYLKLACEEPEEIWEYLNVDAGNLIYYPFNDKGGAERPNPDVAATHGNTKYPWVSWDLANDYINKMIDLNRPGHKYKEVSLKEIKSQWVDQ